MCRLIATIGLFLFSLSGIIAQEQLDFNTINMETYRLYTGQEWDSLIAMGKEALKQDIDYYYLRMRLGIAYYTKKNFKKASIHFNKAIAMNQGDPVAMEYLYYSNLLSGNKEQAKHVRNRFKGALALKLPPQKGKFMEKIGAEYLYHHSMNEDLFTIPDQLFTGLPQGVQHITRNFSNAAIHMASSISPGFSLIQTYTYLSKHNHFYYNDGTYQLEVSDQHVYQHQYGISPQFTTPSGYTIMPVFHLINVHFQSPVVLSQGYMGGSSQVGLAYFTENDLVTGMGFRKGICTVDLELGAYYATLNNTEQIQNRLGVTWFPTGNLNLYVGMFLNSQYELKEGEGLFRTIPEILIGYAIGEKVWLDLKAVMGEMVNYTENNGMIIYNSYGEVIDKKVTFSISIPVSDKGSLLYLGGRWTSNRSEFIPYDPILAQSNNTITYNTFSIYGGISWKF